MVQCVVSWCKNRADNRHNKNVYANESNKVISFFRFPSDPKKFQLWCEILEINAERISAATRICSIHFEEAAINREKRPLLKPNSLPMRLTTCNGFQQIFSYTYVPSTPMDNNLVNQTTIPNQIFVKQEVEEALDPITSTNEVDSTIVKNENDLDEDINAINVVKVEFEEEYNSLVKNEDPNQNYSNEDMLNVPYIKNETPALVENMIVSPVLPIEQVFLPQPPIAAITQERIKYPKKIFKSAPEVSTVDRATMVSPLFVYNSPERAGDRNRIAYLETDYKKQIRTLKKLLYKRNQTILTLRSELQMLKKDVKRKLS